MISSAAEYWSERTQERRAIRFKLYAQFAFTLFAVGLLAVGLWRWPENGWGSVVWLIGIVLINAIRMPFAKRTRENTITDSRKTGTEKFLLAGMILGAGLLPLVHLATGLFSFADYWMPDWATGIGVLVLGSALWLFWRSHADLGRNWSPTLELREDHVLITGGIYRHIRHPMYSAIWLIVLAQALLVHNWIAGPAAILAFGLMYAIRMPREEDMMRERFGDAYSIYCQKTGRLWPRLL